MTTEQVAVATKYIEYHTKAFGYSKPNVEFRQGYIERLADLGLEDNSFDIIMYVWNIIVRCLILLSSNCVINLSPEKDAVLREAFRVLKPGGELYFSDVYSNKRVPKELVSDPVLLGECLSGALYWNDFISIQKSHIILISLLEYP
jgi:ubiquinone/menaquinone biosynthesis C-methylase UbiE